MGQAVRHEKGVAPSAETVGHIGMSGAPEVYLV